MREEIKVKGQAPVAVDLNFTRHGPVIFVDQQNHRAFALRSAWLEPGMAPYYGSVRYMRAENFDQFKQATESWSAPALTWFMPTCKATSDGWLEGWRLSAPIGMACCRCRATDASSGQGAGRPSSYRVF